MKTRLLAALTISCFALPALAQTSINIYGIVDAGVQVSDFGDGKQYNLASGIAEGSRIGFKGTEDMGGGFKAIFTLESRMEVDTGEIRNGFLGKNPPVALLRGLPLPPTATTALGNALAANPAIVNPNGALFDRTAMVGLVTPVGAFLLGRQYTPAYEVAAISDTFETGSAGGWGSIISGLGALYTPGIAIRTNNALQYRLQLPMGLIASLMYSPEHQASGSLGVSNRFRAAGLRYQAGPWDVGIAYNAEDSPNGQRSLRTAVGGGSYTYGVMKFFAGYLTMKNDNPSLGFALTPSLAPVLGTAGAPLLPAVVSTINANARLDGVSYTLGMHYHIGTGRLMAAIARTTNDLIPDADVTMLSLGYDYNFSKRTDVYIFFARANNDANAQYALGGGGYSGGVTTRGGENATALQLGIRHRF